MGFGKWKVLTVEKREPDCGESEERKWRKPRCLSQELRRKRREVSLEARVCFRLIVLLQLCLTFQLMFYYHLIFYMCTFMGTIYKYKCTLVLNEVKVARSCPTLCNPTDCIVREILQARILEWVAFPSPGDLPNPGIESRSPALLADSLPAEPQRKPKTTGVGGLSLLQQIFPTRNWTGVSCIVGKFFTNWAIREALFYNNKF